jgi:hypothetical protein
VCASDADISRGKEKGNQGTKNKNMMNKHQETSFISSISRANNNEHTRARVVNGVVAGGFLLFTVGVESLSAWLSVEFGVAGVCWFHCGCVYFSIPTSDSRL